MKHSKGHFLSLDGIDGVGKSTQIRFIADLLTRRGHSCLTTRDPGSSQVGGRIRELLLDSDLTMNRRTEAMLFMASRCEMVQSVIRPALAASRCVISDRFLLANVVYQSVGGQGEDVTPDWIWRIGHLANGDLRPNLTLLLDMPAEAAIGRLGRPADRMESRGSDYLEQVRQAFLEQLPRASDHTVVIDADQPVEQVSDAIRDAIEDYFSEAG